MHANKSADSDVKEDSFSDDYDAGVVPEIETEHKDAWETFINQLDLFFRAKGVKKDKQKAHLSNQTDTEDFKLINRLVSLEKLSDKTYDQIVELMKDHLKSKPSEMMKKLNFM